MKRLILFMMAVKIEINWWFIKRYEKRTDEWIKDDIPLTEARYKKIGKKLLQRKKEAKEYAYYYEVLAGLRKPETIYI